MIQYDTTLVAKRLKIEALIVTNNAQRDTAQE